MRLTGCIRLPSRSLDAIPILGLLPNYSGHPDAGLAVGYSAVARIGLAGQAFSFADLAASANLRRRRFLQPFQASNVSCVDPNTIARFVAPLRPSVHSDLTEAIVRSHGQPRLWVSKFFVFVRDAHGLKWKAVVWAMRASPHSARDRSIRGLGMMGLASGTYPEGHTAESSDMTVCHYIGIGSVMRHGRDQRSMCPLARQK